MWCHPTKSVACDSISGILESGVTHKYQYTSIWSMTNVMHKFLIYLTIYFCLTCFKLSFSHLQRQVYNFGSGSTFLSMLSVPPATDTIPKRLKSCTPASEDELKESLKHARQK
jgi:hypothetical protein